MESGFVSVVLVLLYGYLGLKSRRADVSGPSRGRRNGAAPFAYLLKIPAIQGRLLPVLYPIRMALAVLEGGSCSTERLIRWAAKAAGISYAVLLICWLLAFMADNPAAGGVGSVVAVCIPLLQARDVRQRVELRRQAFVKEMPVFLSRVLVLVSAGENVLRALERSANPTGSGGGHPLYEELRAVVSALGRGESLQPAFEEFGRRCAVPEAKLFAATILMNAKRGGETLVPALRELTRQMWEKRKAAARILGEQASSRLAFPLALIFLLIVVLVGAPALMTM